MWFPRIRISSEKGLKSSNALAFSNYYLQALELLNFNITTHLTL